MLNQNLAGFPVRVLLDRNTPVKLAFGVDKINNKLNFCMGLGNIVKDNLLKVPKNPRPASWDIANIQNDLQP